jgi:hypothetical protein
MSQKQFVNDGNPDGAVFGQSATDKIGFYGLTTPIVRPTGATAVATTASTTTTPYGFTTSTQANAIVTALNATIANLKALGLVG